MGLAIANNNPGNLRDASTGDFRKFSSPQEGYAALLNDLQAKQQGTTTTGLGPSSSLVDFASKYAPAGDNNNVGQYAANLANKMGVAPNTQLKDLDLQKWAAAVANNEDKDSVFGKQQIEQGYNPHPFSGEGAIIDFSGLPDAVTQKPQEAFHGTGIIGSAQDVSRGILKGGTDTLLGVGHLGEGIQSLVGKGLDALTGNKYGFENNAQQSIFNPQTAQGAAIREENKATNLSEKVGKGIETAAEALVPIGGEAKSAGLIGNAPSTLERIATDISPKLSAKEAAANLEKFGGTAAGLIRRAAINQDPAVGKMADIVAEHVPDFKPGGSLINNINVTKDAVARLADELKSKVVAGGKDIIYPARELNSAMNKAIAKNDVSIGLKGTQFEKQAAALKDAAMQIVQKNGGRVSDLLDSRKEFDALVDKIYPNLYDKEYTPIRNAVKSVRDTMTDFTASHLPSGNGLKDSLKTQSSLIRVIENMAEKAASGEEKEIGKSGAQNVLQKHPYITGLIGGTAAYQGAKHLPIIGGLLP